MLREFRDFLLRGNIVELAVAFVIGVAFGALITSFVDNLLMPVVAMIFGEQDFRDLSFTINDAVFSYGAFLTDLIAFLAIAAAVFFLSGQAGERACGSAQSSGRGGHARRGASPSGTPSLHSTGCVRRERHLVVRRREYTTSVRGPAPQRARLWPGRACVDSLPCLRPTCPSSRCRAVGVGALARAKSRAAGRDLGPVRQEGLRRQVAHLRGGASRLRSPTAGSTAR